MSQGLLDFFVLEASEYTEQLDGALARSAGNAPDLDLFTRNARALRGSATMARVDGIVLSLKTRVPKTNPVLQTISDIFPGGIIYERELADLFDVERGLDLLAAQTQPQRAGKLSYKDYMKAFEQDAPWFYRREGNIGLFERLAAAWRAFRSPRG